MIIMIMIMMVIIIVITNDDKNFLLSSISRFHHMSRIPFHILSFLSGLHTANVSWQTSKS